MATSLVSVVRPAFPSFLRFAPLLALLVPLLAAAPARADCNDPFGKPDELLDFHIRIKRADWNRLLASRVPSTDGNRAACDATYPEVPAEFRCGNDPGWLKIALRKKRGEERGIEAPLKPPMKIDFNEDFMGMVPEAMGQGWPTSWGKLGYRKITLNNGQGNKFPGRTLMLPNLLSEHVALRLLRREVPSSPGTAFARVTLYFEDKPEGEYHGAYLLIEDIDKSALRRRWGRDDGRLIKASKAGCPNETQFDDGPPNAAAAAFDSMIGKSAGSFAGRWYDEVAKGVDLETTLRQEAIREILVNGDDTLFFAGGNGNNWFAYDPKQGVRQYMPWDVDLTFGQQQQNCEPNPLHCPFTFPLLTWCGRNRSRLGAATACNTEIQRRYLQVMCQLTNGSLSADEIIKVWDAADKTVRQSVGQEKDLIWRNVGDPLSTTTDKSYGSEYVRLREWIPQRIRSVQQQINSRGVTCTPGCPAGTTESCSYLGCPGERRCENNLWTTCRPLPGCASLITTPPPGTTDGGSPPGEGGGADAGAGNGGGGAGGAGSGMGGSGGAAGNAPPGAGGGVSGSSGTAGAGGAPGGSAPPADPGRGSGAGPASVPPATPPAEAGCQCIAGARAPVAPVWMVLLLPLLLALRRRIGR
jgi:hypothetical protein